MTESLTVLEARLFTLAKNQADRALHDELRHIIAAHGYDPNDGKKYNFTLADDGTLQLEING